MVQLTDAAETAPSSDDVTAEALVARLRTTFATGRTRDLEWRQSQLAAIESLIDQREQEIEAALSEDLGRGGFDAYVGDIASTRIEVAHARKHLKHWTRGHKVKLPMSMRPGKAEYRYEPLGVVLVVSPWNYPAYLALAPLVGAIAAGNCVVVKPSEHTPATSALLARLIPEYLDSDAVAVVEGAADETKALIDTGLDHILFTGGTAIGRAVMEAAAPHLTPVTLELGGKCPVIVTPEANLDVTARRVASSKLLNAGQTCVAPDYVLVDRTVADRFVEALQAAITEFTRKDEGLARTVVNERHAQRLAGLLDGHGGTVVLGGEARPAERSVDMTVIVDPDTDSELMGDEIFGPILPVIGVDSLDEAIRFVQARPKPLAAYLFSDDGDEHERFLTEISAGGSAVNQVAMHCLVPDLPFGGVGTSGIGAYHGEWGFQTFSHRKSVLRKPTRPDPKLTYPPYGGWKEKLLRRVL
ncbi:MAG: aldehyde dehydrogenase family protein [Actinomycetota bacterium]|nr:aldehyde dehydrogenase family protein [Actinomycetota bacterium]